MFTLSLCFFVVSCGRGETPESCAKKYCEINARVKTAVNDVDKQKAKRDRNDYENELEKKYKGDEEFFKNFERAVELCSGGR